MPYKIISRIHKLAAITATLCIALFFTSTLIVELFGSHEAIALVKSRILFPGLLVLIPAIIATGGSGFVLSKNRRSRLIHQKKKRMPMIGANGMLILIPCAIVLDKWAAVGSFGTTFYLVQSLELMAGGINLALMGFNMRDGMLLSGKLRRTT